MTNTIADRVAPTVHEIKIEPHYLQAVRDGRKTFEIRFNDRGYQAGDKVVMAETEWPRRKVEATISYVTGFKQQENWVVFALSNVKELSDDK